MTIEQLPYGKPIRSWLKERYGEARAKKIWMQTQKNYRSYLPDLPDYGGSKNGHAKAIYGGLLIFAPADLRTAGFCPESVHGVFYKARKDL